MKRLALLAAICSAPQAEPVKLRLESAMPRYNPSGVMNMKFSIENGTDAEASLEEPADWLDGLEVRDGRNNVVKAAGTSKASKRSHAVDGKGFIGRTVDISPALKGKNFEEGFFKFKWSWMGRTSSETTVMVIREYRVKFETNFGDFAMEVWPEAAPMHVKTFLELVGKGFYDRKQFYRVSPGYVIQGGAGRAADAGFKLKAEFNNRKHVAGTVSMARGKDPDSGSTEFFIVLADTAPAFDGAYTGFGQVVEGMETIREIAKVKTDHSPCKGCGKALPATFVEGHCLSHHDDAPAVEVVMKKVTFTEIK
jgi:cyclophilin family peptidyl-prolyl cis-trans isomerase